MMVSLVGIQASAFSIFLFEWIYGYHMKGVNMFLWCG